MRRCALREDSWKGPRLFAYKAEACSGVGRDAMVTDPFGQAELSFLCDVHLAGVALALRLMGGSAEALTPEEALAASVMLR